MLQWKQKIVKVIQERANEFVFEKQGSNSAKYTISTDTVFLNGTGKNIHNGVRNRIAYHICLSFDSFFFLNNSTGQKIHNDVNESNLP
jgi:hypothetical protein